MWQVAKRPKWIAALVFALALAGVFAGLAQWQLQRSIAEATVIERDTENAVPLASVAIPQSVITSEASGRMVSTECDFVPGDDVVLENRRTPQGTGSWLLRHCMTQEGHSLAVVLGWSPGPIEPGAIGNPPMPILGRYVPTEAPQLSDFQSGERSMVAVGELINLWADPGPVYGGYVVLSQAPAGLITIGTEAPPTDRQLNWLNLFYAAEWIIFAGFAIYLWFRLVKDEWLREQEVALSAGP